MIVSMPFTAVATLVQHVGTNDPTVESWTKGEGPNTTSAAVVDSGTSTWNINDICYPENLEKRFLITFLSPIDISKTDVFVRMTDCKFKPTQRDYTNLVQVP
jgi:hypothetical protein